MKIDGDGEDAFVPIEDPAIIYPVAFERLPKACNIFNMILMAMKIPGYREHVQFFAVNGDTDPNTSWLIAVDQREDHGTEINICIPQQGPHNEDKMLDVFARTKAIDWRKQFMVCALHGRESEFMLKLQLKVLANPVLVIPANLYSMDPEIGRNLQLPPIPPNLELKSVDTGVGADFICANWHHRAEGSISYIRRSVTHLPSSGLYCDGELAAGAITSLTGFIGYLYTSKAHRGRGFGQLVVMHLIKQLAEENYIPHLTVQTLHYNSVRFHETKIEGLELSHKVEFMFHTPEKFDD